MTIKVPKGCQNVSVLTSPVRALCLLLDSLTLNTSPDIFDAEYLDASVFHRT